MCAGEGCEIKDTWRMQNISEPDRQKHYCSQVPKELCLIVSHYERTFLRKTI